jgi:SRSO17 transposase
MAYLRGLLSVSGRKNGWHLAEQAGEMTPDGMQRLLNGSVWDVEGVRDEVRSYTIETLGATDAVLVVDESGFVKKGERSVGVKRQYSGTAGRVENCQIGVFLAYASYRGRSLIDRELYLPKEWVADEKRRQVAGVPPSVTFATKPELARRMLERTFQAGVSAQWVLGDTVYGGDRTLRRWLEDQQQAFVLAVGCDERFWWEGDGHGWQQWRADELAALLATDDWWRLSAGAGTKGPRLYDWAWFPLPRWQEETSWQHGLLLRRSLSQPSEVAYYAVFAPRHASLSVLVQVAGQRWTVEECFELAKNELGLDEYEVRRWVAWYRHVTLVMLAQAYLNAIGLEANLTEKKQPASLDPLEPGRNPPPPVETDWGNGC